MPVLDSIWLVVGIAMLVGGGESLVRGAAALAQQLGVPALVVGLTVVAFGTSAPELAVNTTAALRGNGAIAFGNVIGSNLANLGLILAVAALTRPIAVRSIVITREIPMLLLASTAALVMGVDLLRGQAESGYDRSDGLVLLLFFAVFLYYTIAETLKQRSADPFVKQARGLRLGVRLRTLGTSGGLVIGGMAGLMLGGHLTVTGAVGVAEALGVPKNVIGLTIVAVGTSLPELSASLMAARRGETDLALGNVVGSNLFNLLFILAVTATIAPVPVPVLGHADLAAMVALAVVLLPLSLSQGKIGRFEGGLLIAVYSGYVLWRLS